MDAPPEGRVFGRYAVFDVIASGGMASVHYGRLLGEVGFARTIAIKRLHPQFAHDTDFVSMLLDEARLVARIQHPNVVPTLDVVADDGELLLVMEYVAGESLARLIRAAIKGGELVPPAIAVAIISGALRGLHAAHEARGENGERLGIVHRDVSPQNIIVGADGHLPVLASAWLWKWFRHEEPAAVAGTPSARAETDRLDASALPPWWDVFLDPDADGSETGIAWQRVVAGGLAVGAGYAALLAKHHSLARAVLLAGPCDFTRGPALWVTRDATWATDASAFFALAQPRGDLEEGVCRHRAEVWRRLGIPASHQHEDAATCDGNPLVRGGAAARCPENYENWTPLLE